VSGFRKAKSNLAGGSRAPSRDGHDPNANGLIRVVAVQPDGKILIGGDFTTLPPRYASKLDLGVGFAL
jgi:hypothetical protein